MVRAVSAKSWTAKAKRVAGSLKAEYQAGKEGDESPAMPIWPTPKEQLDKLLGLLSSTRSAAPPPPEELETDAQEVTEALRGVDWASVRAATAARTSEASRAMRAAAERVDWTKVQPIAAQVSRALIAAAASGQIPLGGRLGTTVASPSTSMPRTSRCPTSTTRRSIRPLLKCDLWVGNQPDVALEKDRHFARLVFDIPFGEELRRAFAGLPTGDRVEGRAVGSDPGAMKVAAVFSGAGLHLGRDPVDALLEQLIGRDAVRCRARDLEQEPERHRVKLPAAHWLRVR
jgi:hypothetical protein